MINILYILLILSLIFVYASCGFFGALCYFPVWCMLGGAVGGYERKLRESDKVRLEREYRMKALRN